MFAGYGPGSWGDRTTVVPSTRRSNSAAQRRMLAARTLGRGLAVIPLSASCRALFGRLQWDATREMVRYQRYSREYETHACCDGAPVRSCSEANQTRAERRTENAARASDAG